MTVRIIRIGCDHTPRRGKHVFSTDVEINGRGHSFETRANNVIEALDDICARLARDFADELDTYDRREMPTATVMRCLQCEGCGWICEEHPGRPWEGQHACPCGAAGMPCPLCNQPAEGEEPRLPDRFRTESDKKGWRH